MTDAPVTHADIDPDWFLVSFGALALAVVVLATVRAVRTRDVAPLAVCAGALVCALNEPIFDELGKIVYATGAVRAYSAFGRDIPLFLVIGYVPWVGALPYVIAELISAGASRARLHWIAFASFASVVVVETAGTSLGAWTYYGDAPLKYLGVAPMMAPVPIVAAVLLVTFAERLRGAQRMVLAAVPVFALPAVYASAGMPMYVALHADTSKLVQYLAGAATLALCALIVAAATLIASAAQERTVHAAPSTPRSPAGPAST